MALSTIHDPLILFAISAHFSYALAMAEQIALVTGATGGLGTHVTRALLQAGFTVAGVAPTVHSAELNHPKFVAVPAQLDTFDAAREAAEIVIGHFSRIDLLAHLVGGFAGGQSVAETDDATFQRMFRLNVNTAFHILRAVVPHMRSAGRGRIIAIGSRAAENPGPMVGAYSASKAALVSLIRTVALENKDVGITANVILPGTIDTPANRQAMPDADISQWVQPSSIASLVLWLAGDAGKDVTGAAIPIYGRGL